MNIFQLKNISKEHCLGSVILKSLKNVNLEIDRGKFYSILGPEGAGKSRILYLLGLTDLPSTGNIYYKGNNILNLDEKESSRIRNQEIGFVPQSFHLNSTISILENVSMISRILGEDNWVAEEKAEFWLSKVGLEAKINAYPIELSLEEFKRVALAKMMVKKPEIILADEIYQHLDYQEANNLLKLLTSFNKEYQVTIVQATRCQEFTKYSDVIYKIKDGYSSVIKSDTATAA